MSALAALALSLALTLSHTRGAHRQRACARACFDLWQINQADIMCARRSCSVLVCVCLEGKCCVCVCVCLCLGIPALASTKNE